jgi:hypothetical protein
MTLSDFRSNERMALRDFRSNERMALSDFRSRLPADCALACQRMSFPVM